MAEHGIAAIDLLVVNLYPFEATAAAGARYVDCIENIDIGGPALIRAAAKNHADVAVVVEPGDYATVTAELTAHGGATTLALRRRLAAKAFARTAAYDAAIANWFAAELGTAAPQFRDVRRAPHRIAPLWRKPPPGACVLCDPGHAPGVASARQVQGKQLSYNNINDTDAAYECVAEFDPARTAACAIIKHANPCGVAEGTDLKEAYRRALACDPDSAFGGIVALNRPLDADAARAITEIFTEVIIAPAATPEAEAIVAAKKQLRLLIAGGPPEPARPGPRASNRSPAACWCRRATTRWSTNDAYAGDEACADASRIADLRFAFRVAKHVKSNTIVYAKDGATVGIGAGQMSRVDSARIAARKAADAATAPVLRRRATGIGGRLGRILPSPTGFWSRSKPAPRP